MSKALLIEDDRKLAALLVEFLGQHGVEATVAGDSSQALQHLGSSRFDILLLDLMLRGWTGSRWHARSASAGTRRSSW